MRTVEVLQLVAAVVGTFFSVAIAVETRLVKRIRLRSQGATSGETAIRLGNILPITRWRLRRLQGTGAVCTIDSGAVYLDEESYGLMRNRRRKTALLSAVMAVVAVLIIYLLS